MRLLENLMQCESEQRARRGEPEVRGIFGDRCDNTLVHYIGRTRCDRHVCS